ELVQLLGHLLEREAIDADHDGHAADLGVLRRTHRERVDVEPTPAEQARDPGENARLVLDKNGQCVAGHQSSRSHAGARSRAVVMRSLLVPAGTIGHTIASRCTWKSITTGASLSDMAFSITASTCSRLSARRP